MRKYLLFLSLWIFIAHTAAAQSTRWEEQNDFVNGYARVFHLDKFSFINHQQQLISDFLYSDARNFYHGRAAVKSNDKWGFINSKGKLIIPASYEIVYDFRSPVTIAYAGRKWSLIDTSGRLLKELDITLCYGFENGTAIVYKKDLRGHMDLQGNIVFEKAIAQPAAAKVPYHPAASLLNNCPDNLDFEFGNFTNWNCFTGRVDSVGTTNVITVNPSPPTPGRHTIYARTVPSALDPFGLFPLNPPDGSQFAVKLGNTGVGAQAERIQYVIHVPLNDSNFSFRYHYAVVLQDPGHTSWTQPRFTAKILDSATNTYIDCASFEYISTSNLPGFTRSTVDTSVIYKAWSPVFINLRGYAGKTLYLEFTTADCVRRAHWGYAYVDVEDMCGQPIQVNYQCDSPHVTTLTGPPGFQFYNWWNTNFTTLLGTGQTITLNPGPPPNTLFWVELVPYANFGCLDTLPVRVNGSTAASFSSNDTLGICAPHSFTFYNQNVPSAFANWDFGDGTTGAGDTVTHTFNLPGTYIVTLQTSDISGCTGVATDTVTIVQPSGSFSYTGGTFCNSRLVTYTATTNYADSLIWDFGDGTILHTTQTTVTHLYSSPGIYVTKLTVKSNFGCQLLIPGTDTVKIEKMDPGFISQVQQPCDQTIQQLTDTSHALFGIASRVWYFSDGSSATGNTVSHVYTSSGIYTVKLVITGTTGCRDSISRDIYIKVNKTPSAGITGPATVCVNTPVVFDVPIVSDDPIGLFYWVCNNGTNGTAAPFTINFSTPGTYIIRVVIGTIYGCYDTVYKNITINPVPGASIMGAATVCQNSAPQKITFTGSGSTAPYTFTYTVNNGAPQTITTVTGDTVSVYVSANVPGTYVYKLIKVQDQLATGCVTSLNDSVIVKINPLPAAGINGAATVCLNAPNPRILFTGSGGTAPYYFIYRVNDGLYQTITTVTGDTVSVTVPTTVAGSFVYKLLRVQDASSTACQRDLVDSVIIKVNPLPAAVISSSATVCLNTASPKITFTGSGSTAPYTFMYMLNNGVPQTITTVTGDTVSVFAPTNQTGTFIYKLVKVQDAGITGCYTSINDSVIIKVNPLPAALIGSDATVCQYGGSPRILFTGSGSTRPYTFSYKINNGTTQTISTVTGDTVSLWVPTQTAGQFTYKLLRVQDASASACFTSLNDSAVVNINPAPLASLGSSNAVCINAAAPRLTFRGAAGTAPYTFIYRINNDPLQTIVSGPGDSVVVWAPTNMAGRFVYKLISVQDASSTSCLTALTDSAVINVEALPVVNAGPDKMLCQGNPVQLLATGAQLYTWTPPVFLSCANCANPVASPTDTTEYIVKGSSAIGCSATDTVKLLVIKPFPMFVAPGDTICSGETVSLNATGADRYLWSPATGLNRPDIASPVAKPLSTTNYRVIGTDQQGCFSDTGYVKITVGQSPQVDAGPDLTLSAGDVVTLNPSAQNGPISTWQWEPPVNLSCTSCQQPKLTVHGNSVYTVTVTNMYGCRASDIIAINTFCKSANVFVPNAFTPDGDGLNDVLMVRGKGIHVVYFRIFNRWGELVFEKNDFAPNDPLFGWDGRVRGVPATPDVFVYTVQVVCDNNVLQTLKGNTTILK